MGLAQLAFNVHVCVYGLIVLVLFIYLRGGSCELHPFVEVRQDRAACSGGTFIHEGLRFRAFEP